MKNLNEKNYNSVLNETSDFFRSQGISIIGEGYKEIATDAALFESYVQSLTEGASADHAAVMSSLMENTNNNILRESALAGIQPIASLSMPVIRKLWPKFALKDAIKTEVAKTPRFVVAYTKPYLVKGDVDGEPVRVELPKGLNDYTGAEGVTKTKLVRVVTVTNGIGTADFAAEPGEGEEGTCIIKNTGSAIKRQPLDTEFRLTKVGETVVYNTRLDVSGNIVYDYKTTSGAAATILVRADLKGGKASVAVIGDTVATVELTAYVSPEYNEDSWSVEFDIARLDIDIPAGAHINASLPIESLNDMKALYNIDGTKEAVDLMTNTMSQRLDKEILKFLKDSFMNQPALEMFKNGLEGYEGASNFTLVFDVRPAAGFAGSPKAWREELRPQIDYLAQKIKNATYLTTGMFTIIGNPLDIQILQNVDWQFRGGQGSNMDGVDVDYSIGTYVGANAYKVISSTNVPQGAMYLVFTPSSDTQMTYKYFPYTFSTEMGYIDPNRSRVPSIMMTKRHTMAEFMPAIGCIGIVNNDGMGQFNPYIQTKEWGAADWNAKETYPDAE